MNEEAKRLSNRPYITVLEYETDPEGFTGYFAYHPDLPGCMAQGMTPQEAKANLTEARLFWIQCLLEDGLPVPEPQKWLGKELTPKPVEFDVYSPTMRDLQIA